MSKVRRGALAAGVVMAAAATAIAVAIAIADRQAFQDDGPAGKPVRSWLACAEAMVLSIAFTAVARLPSESPDPWVPVATAPPTEMWGSDPRLWVPNTTSTNGARSSSFSPPLADRRTIEA